MERGLLVRQSSGAPRKQEPAFCSANVHCRPAISKMDTGLHKALDIVLMTMLESHQGVSDLLFVTGKPAQVEAHGKLQPVPLDEGLTPLDSGRAENVAAAMWSGNSRLGRELAHPGSGDCSYIVPDICRV